MKNFTKISLVILASLAGAQALGSGGSNKEGVVKKKYLRDVIDKAYDLRDKAVDKLDENGISPLEHVDRERNFNVVNGAKLIGGLSLAALGKAIWTKDKWFILPVVTGFCFVGAGIFNFIRKWNKSKWYQDIEKNAKDKVSLVDEYAKAKEEAGKLNDYILALNRNLMRDQNAFVRGGWLLGEESRFAFPRAGEEDLFVAAALEKYKKALCKGKFQEWLENNKLDSSWLEEYEESFSPSVAIQAPAPASNQ